MAQVSSGSFITTGYDNRYLRFNWSVDSTSITGNYKKIYWSLVGDGGTGFYYKAGNFKVVIDGETVYEQNQDYRIELYKDTVVASGYKILYHDNEGKKSFSASVEAGIYYYARNVSGSGTWELPTIPRYANFTNCNLSNLTENSVTINWGADVLCDGVAYSINDMEWVYAWGDITGSSIPVSSLSANTNYNIKVAIRRKDSQLWSYSDLMYFTTYNYPHCTSTPDFTIGDALTLDFYNPLGRYITITGYALTDGSIIFSGTTTGTRTTGYNSTNGHNGLNEIASQYASIPNAQSGRYKVVVSYNGVAMTRDAGNIYRIRGNEVPIINGFDYIDGNADTVVITGNETHIVQNKSILMARFHSATANYGAGSIAKYIVECNGKTAEGSKEGQYSLGAIDSGNNVDLTLTAIDSRGLSASKTIKVTMLAHTDPTAIVTLQRLNNYEDETYLTVDGSVSSVNGKNTMTIKYRYKVSGGSYGSFVTIGDRAKQTLTLDKNNVYVFNVVITDAVGATYDKEHQLGKGVFPLFIDTGKNSVGVNKFPLYENSVEASGTISVGERIAFELEAGASREVPIFLHGITGLVNFRMAGANLEVAKLFYVFRSNQYFGVHTTLVDASYNNTSSSVAFEMRNTEQGYTFKITNNHSTPIYVRYGVLELC